ALYTYEDGSDDLKLAASGGGGLLELSGHFEIQKVMYGFCSVKDPQAVLPKYVLVNWVGEDVPDARKCACASHVAKIAEFFQGVDVIVNASSVEDGTTYQKTDATVEMKRLNREQFWEQAKVGDGGAASSPWGPKEATGLLTDSPLIHPPPERGGIARKQQSMEAEEARQRLKEQSIFGDHQEEDDRQQFRKSESEVE
ncbi:PREDICTED: drebrin-like, partial [Acanthisitta chloris]|uniref:drebrin-like n=1 Tax=Acanthisitta chloris TaxID=57068 RepID=UPI0004F0F678